MAQLQEWLHLHVDPGGHTAELKLRAISLSLLLYLGLEFDIFHVYFLEF